MVVGEVTVVGQVEVAGVDGWGVDVEGEGVGGDVVVAVVSSHVERRSGGAFVEGGDGVVLGDWGLVDFGDRERDHFLIRQVGHPVVGDDHIELINPWSLRFGGCPGE